MFCYGWPKVLSRGRDDVAGSGGARPVALEYDECAAVLAVVTASDVEIWSCGQHRRLIGKHARSPGELTRDGSYVAAKFRSGKSSVSTLAAVLSSGRVHVFDLSFSTGGEVIPGVPDAKCGVQLRATINLHASASFTAVPAKSPRSPAASPGKGVLGASCLSIAGDGNVMLLGMSNGAVVQCSWDHSARRGVVSHGDPCGSVEAAFAPRLGVAASQSSSTGRGNGSAAAAAASLPLDDAVSPRANLNPMAVVALDYNASTRMAAAVLACGKCAVLAVGDGGDGGAGEEGAWATSFGSGKTAGVGGGGGGGGGTAAVAERLRCERWIGGEDAVSARVSPSMPVVAVGTRSGEVHVFHVRSGGGGGGSAPADASRHLRTFSLADWGYTPEDTGGVSDLRWSADGSACAVGWSRRGLAVWSAAGCRLMCSLRQGGGSAGTHHAEGGWGGLGSPAAKAVGAGGHGANGAAMRWDANGGGSSSSPGGFNPNPTIPREGRGEDDGVARIAWGAEGYQLFAASAGAAGDPAGTMDGNFSLLQEFSFALVATQRHLDVRRHSQTYLLHAPDRIIVATVGGGAGSSNPDSGMTVRHVLLPQAYAAPNWPLRHVAISEDGQDVAAAGSRGLILHNFRTGKWRFFGDISQEREFTATALVWIDGIVAVCTRSARGGGGGGDEEENVGGGGWWFTGSGNGGSGGNSQGMRRSSSGNLGKEDNHAIRFYPKYHLDASSLLLNHPLGAPPLTLSALGKFLLIATPPFEVAVFETVLKGELNMRGDATVSLRPVRHISLANHTPPPVALALLPAVPPKPDPNSPTARQKQARALEVGYTLGPRPSPPPPPPPVSAMVLRCGGALSLLDLTHHAAAGTGNPTAGSSGPTAERHLADGVENFWVASGAADPPATSADIRWSWWTYGAHGMQVWYVPPGGLEPPPVPAHGGGRVGGFGFEGGKGCPPGVGIADAAADDVAFTDPELEFDREAYPLGVSLGQGSPLVAGMTQRLAFTTCVSAPCFEPTPKAQPILPCLLRHLLRRGELGVATRVASLAASRPHFTHSLEWLLFSALDRHAGTASASPGTPAASAAESALSAALGLIRAFPEYLDVVVAVARKTDSRDWPALFEHAGDPSALQRDALRRGQLRTAACYLLVVDKLAGAAVGAEAAGELLATALERREYRLTGELVRFLARPAVEETAATEARLSSSAKKRTKGGSKASPVAPPAVDGRGGANTGGSGSGFFRWLGFGGGGGDDDDTADPPVSPSTPDAVESPESVASPTIRPDRPRRSRRAEDVPATPSGVTSVPGASGGFVAVLPPRLRALLRDHAASLCRAVDLGALAAFMRETDFDLGVFLEHEATCEEGGGAAHLEDFTAALTAAADSLTDSLKRHVPRGDADRRGEGGHLGHDVGAEAGGVWSVLGVILEQVHEAGCTEWALVCATMLRRLDVVLEIVGERGAVHDAWTAAVDDAAKNAAERGDHSQARFLASLREEMAGVVAADGCARDE